MTNQETVTGMVLSAMPIGDYDKRVVILTKEHGKISAFAKGARRPNSAFLACSQPFVFGTFHLFMGRSSYTIQSVEVTNYFEGLKGDLETLYYGFYFCEFTDYLTKENVEAVGMLKLLYQGLRVLEKKKIKMELCRYIFELKIISLNGEAPQVFECVNQRLQRKKHENLEFGKKDLIKNFSSMAGGIVCDICSRAYKDIIKISPSTEYTLQFIVATPVKELFTFTVSEEVLKELKKVAASYRETHVDTIFKSLDFL